MSASKAAQTPRLRRPQVVLDFTYSAETSRKPAPVYHGDAPLTVGKGVMTETAIADLRLINRILRRDETALSELYTQYGSQVFGITLHVLQDRTLAEEATQDTFLKIWNSAHKWDAERGKLSTWIFTIARYTAIDILRREVHQIAASAVELDEMIQVAGQPGHHNDALDAELMKSLIARLPPEQIEAIELAFFKGMTHQEIAAHLRQPLGTIKSRIRGGLQMLRGIWLREMR